MTLTESASALRTRLAGLLLEPGDAGWDDARQPWNRAIDQRPDAVVVAERPDDIAATALYAAEHGLRVAVQGTGHGAGALGDLAGTILVRTERMRDVTVDPERRSVRVGAGVLWQEAADAADAHDLAVLAGSSPDVGVVGYTLGGGMSWLARRHGLCAANVLSAEVVTADGRVRHIDDRTDPELFWAIRGGGGSFAAVTALELRAFALTEVYAGWLVWPMEDAARVLRAWRDWTASLPDEITSCARLLHVPPLPDVPEPFRGRSLVAVEAVTCGGRAEADALLSDLRALGPEIDTFLIMRPRELGAFHLDPDHPTPAIGNGMLLDDLPDAVIDDLVDTLGVASGTPLLSVEIRHTGGAMQSVGADAGAAGVLPGDFAVFALGVPFEDALRAPITAAVDRIEHTLASSRCGRYMNFTERRVDAAAFFTPSVLDRLRAVKAAYDPADRFRANHPIQSANEGRKT